MPSPLLAVIRFQGLNAKKPPEKSWGLLREAVIRPAKRAERQILIFFHPDCTVGAGVPPAQFRAFAWKMRALTAGRELPSYAGSPRPENLFPA